MRSFQEKYGSWAVVTGATSGTGRHFSRLLAEKGFNLLLVARTEQALEDMRTLLQSTYRIQVKTVAADLSHAGTPAQIAESAQGLEVGLLVNNAGYCLTGTYLEQDEEAQQNMLKTNLLAPMALAHHFGRAMAERRRGGIVFVSSSVAYTPVPLWSVYAAGKAALLSFGEALSEELRGKGVDVLTVCPGAMATGFQQRAQIRTVGAMEPDAVAAQTLRYLGKRVTLMPGLLNKVIFLGIARLLPGRIRRPLFTKMMEKLKEA